MGILCNQLKLHRTMKTFAAALTFCLVATASADITCDDCLIFGGNMQTYLMSAESIAEQIEIIVANVCPGVEDPAGCEEGVRGNWETIALAMYPVFLDANDLCMQLGACAVKSLTSVPTCDECTGSLAAIAGLISDEGQIAEIVAFLQGDAFCAGDADCGAAIAEGMPVIMPVLAAVLTENAATYCCEQSPSAVCC